MGRKNDSTDTARNRKKEKRKNKKSIYSSRHVRDVEARLEKINVNGDV